MFHSAPNPDDVSEVPRMTPRCKRILFGDKKGQPFAATARYWHVAGTGMRAAAAMLRPCLRSMVTFSSWLAIATVAESNRRPSAG